MALRELIAHFGFSYDSAKLRAIDAGVEGLIGKIQGVAQAFAGGLLAAGLNRLATELDVFDDLSARTGIATDTLQALDLAFKVNGSSSQEMAAALTRLQASLGNVAEGSKTTSAAFQALGIETQGASGALPTLAEALPQIFTRFSSLGSEAEKASVATELFGRTGVKLLPVLNQGAKGLEAMHAQLAELGGGASAEAIQSAGEYRDALAKLDTALFSLKGLIATSVFPQLTKLVEASAKAGARFSAWARETTLVDNAALGLAATLAVTLASALAPYVGKALKFAAIFFAIDDLIGFLQGKESVIGTLLNKVFGEGTDDRVRAWLTRTLDNFRLFFSELFGESQLFAANWDATMRQIFGESGQRFLTEFAIFAVDTISEMSAEIIARFGDIGRAISATWKLLTGDFGGAFEIFQRPGQENKFGGVDVSHLRGKPKADAPPKALTFGGIPTPFGPNGPALLAEALGRTTAPLAAALPGANSYTSTVNAPVTVNVPAGTPPHVAQRLGTAAQQGVANAGRSNLQALERTK